MHDFWAWILQYSSLLVTAVLSVLGALIVHRLTTKHAALIYYTSHPQLVTLTPPAPQPGLLAVPVPPPAQQQQPLPIGTFQLFLSNPGKAAAKGVTVTQFNQFAYSVFPDIQRDEGRTAGGNWAIRFPVIPPQTVVSISYLTFGFLTVEQVISFVSWDEGHAKRIPVLLQRVWPKWFNATAAALMLAGIWLALNAAVTLIAFLWRVYYR